MLHVATTIGRADGISTAVVNMVMAFRRGDLQAKVLTAMYEGAPLHSALTQGPDTAVLRARGHSFASYPFGFLGALSHLARQVDLVHLHGLWRYPTLVGGPLLRRLGVPYVLSTHGLLMPEPLRRHALRKAIAYRMAERRTLTGARLIVAGGAGEAQALRKSAPQVPHAVVRLAVDTEVFRPANESSQTDLRRNRKLVSVSRLHPIKRLVELVEAFSRVADRHQEWELVIVGPEDDPGYRRRVEATAASSGISRRVRLIGRLEGVDLVQQYRDANLFVLPSTTESSGLSLVEALAAGVPVIATTGAPWAEIVAEGCGWWVDPGVESLAGALHEAMSTDEHNRKQMAEKARSLAVREYSLEALRGRLVETYRDALARGRSPRASGSSR